MSASTLYTALSHGLRIALVGRPLSPRSSAPILVRGVAGLALLLSIGAPQAVAVDIRFELRDDGENPSYDPDGSRLLAIFEAAASLWEDYLPAGGAHDVDLFWSTSRFGSGSETLGVWSPQLGDNNIHIRSNLPVEGLPKSWFIDATPLAHSEYDFETQNPASPGTALANYLGGKWLYRDVDATAQAAWFSGSPPDLLEIGYRGDAPASDTILNRYDLLSVALHELGHELGVNSLAVFSETLNPDPAWVGGATMTFRRDSESDAHLAGMTPLMTPFIPTGVRALPSAVDIMAAADGSGHASVDLPRQDYLGDGLWSDTLKWLGGATPDGSDEAYLRSFNDVTLDVTGTAGYLLVADQSNLSTGSHLLTANKIDVRDFNTDLFVPAGGTVEANEINLTDDAESELSGGTIEAGILRVRAGSQIEALSGGGSVQVSTALLNEGTLRARSGGVLSISTVGTLTNTWDLDGFTGNGAIDASDGDIIIQAKTLLDDFSGTLEIGAGHFLSIDVANDSDFGIDGTVEFAGGTSLATAAELRSTLETIRFDGAAVAVDGTVSVSTISQWQGVTSTTLNDTATNLYLGENSADPITYGDATFSGPGRLYQQANATVEENKTVNIDTARFDWDGTTGNSETVIRGQMNISGEITDVVDAQITLESGSLSATDSWTLRGGLTSNGGEILTGGQITIDSQLRVLGTTTTIVRAPVLFTSNARVALESGSTLILGETIFRGGTYQGASIIAQNGTATVEQDTTLGVNFQVILGGPQEWVDTYDWDGFSEETAETTIESGATFIINAETIDTAAGALAGYNGKLILDGGSLLVNTGQRIEQSGALIVVEAPWQLRGTMRLFQNETKMPTVGSTVGAALEIYGLVDAAAGESFLQSPLTTLVEGNIFVATHATLNVDAFLATGGLVIVDQFGTLNLTDTTFTSSASMGIAPFGAVNLTGATIFQGGQYAGNGALRQQGVATVVNDIYVTAGVSFTASSQTTINAGATFFNAGGGLENSGPAVVLAGASFTGPGTFRNLPTTTLIFQPGANMQVDVVSDGITTVGLGLFDVGSAQFESFTQMPAGLLAVDLLSATAGMYDSIIADTSITLGGSLEVSLLDDFMPSLGDTFEIVSASSVSGQFDTTLLPTLSGLVWDVQYHLDSVIIEVLNALAADTEPDGDVDGADFLALQRDNPALISTWRVQYGSGASALASAQQVPEPSSSMFLLTAAAWCSSSRFSRRSK